jgi:hypothetical protein
MVVRLPLVSILNSIRLACSRELGDASSRGRHGSRHYCDCERKQRKFGPPEQSALAQDGPDL